MKKPFLFFLFPFILPLFIHFLNPFIKTYPITQKKPRSYYNKTILFEYL
jgi:hypothetical protein